MRTTDPRPTAACRADFSGRHVGRHTDWQQPVTHRRSSGPPRLHKPAISVPQSPLAAGPAARGDASNRLRPPMSPSAPPGPFPRAAPPQAHT
ncbi:hypothetical protein WJ95_32285 [Burkholderia ubonensis]|nr:hypothetical protein WJ95_32285 [Burkholderia ubonensis]KVQ11456.1 hypothetical protein WJ99_15680 [Burkholderia ubonensis]KVT15048.1 hypothetical protein WK47_31260 [Burkholderia ubonensis]KVT30132.1 hypothetical protein WK50_10425 [Burkholderia ubonensis]KVU97041.1 hypothetical protein WK76_04840 [Burkholderia ubonensis]